MSYTKELNIYERMSYVENELGTIEKGMTIGSGNNSYKAVGEGAVLNAVKPLEFEYRIKSLPIKREVIKQDCLETIKDNYTKRMFFITIKTTFRFVNLDNPSDYVDVESLGDGTDPLDKASGKAQTYADKFALLKAYKAITGVDTDNTHSNKYEQDQKEAYKKDNETPKATRTTLSTRTAKLFENLCMSEELQTQWFAHFKVKKLVNLKEEDVLYIIDDVTPKLLNKVLAKLENTDNAQYKGVVMKAMCGHAEVDKWSDITFKGNLTYISFANLVKTELDTAKVVK